MKSLFKKTVTTILTLEAKYLLKRTKPTIIAITGNLGKTSTKDATYAVLGSTLHARKSVQSYNSEIGVPLTILGLQSGWNDPLSWIKNCFDGLVQAFNPEDYPKFLILEIGVDRPGDMEKLTSWITPDVVVLTHLPDVPSHVEFFDSKTDDIVAEKVKLIRALNPEGILVYNQDDTRVAKIAEETLQKGISFSRYSKSDFTGSGDEIRYEDGTAAGLTFALEHDGKKVDVEIDGSIGVKHVYSCAAAAAVGSLYGVSLEDSAKALKSYESPAGRMRLIKGSKETMIIDDTINASPMATEHALRTLKRLTGVHRRIAVLGDMLELGQHSVAAHEKVGKVAAESVDILLTVGIRARGIATGALESGMSPKRIFQYENIERAATELEGMIETGDAVLVKGSQRMRMERLVEEIMFEPQRAGELLVRQNLEWKNKE